MIHPPTLIGDTIENPWNALAMLHAAEMLGSTCLFRDRRALAQTWKQTIAHAADLPCITIETLQATYPSIVACDTFAHAADVYGFRVAKGGATALVVGNERLGVSRDIRAIAQYAVQIPMVSRHITCLNVAAASAVGLYYLARHGGQKQQIRSNPGKKRPHLCLLGAGDHIELGSTIRSACAFGWEHALVDDRFGIWFGCDRVTRSEGRGAARRGHNPIRLLPTAPDTRLTYQDVAVVTMQRRGIPLHRSNLARGGDQLIVIPDESQVPLDGEEWGRFGQRVELIHLDLPTHQFVYHYRLIATIAMAEVARQVGHKPPKLSHERGARKPRYDQALQTMMEERGELIYLDDLVDY